MSLYIASLNSGSNGNCYYVGNDREAILVDAGISCRETEKRMIRIGLSMQNVKAIFVSHEHTDHIRGLTMLAKKYQLPVYATRGTISNSSLKLEQFVDFRLLTSNPVLIGDLVITSFHKLHDAAEPHSFMVSCKNVNIGVFTDLGAVCEQLTFHFKQCHAAFLEANYDDDMLSNGRYPYFLKNRIRGGKGHLSNKQALDLFVSCRPSYMSHLLLSHLSKDNNCPKLVHELFLQHAQHTEIIVASRFEETAVYYIDQENSALINRQHVAATPSFQYSLF